MDRIKAQVLQEIARAINEVIGDNEPETIHKEDKIINQVRNELRSEMRHKFNKYIKELQNGKRTFL
jgi:hypothetical protein